MTVFDDVRDDIAGKLAAAGVVATLDPRAQPPCVIVDVPRVTGSTGVRGWTVEVPVLIAAPPPGDADAVAWMLGELEPTMVTFPTATADPRPIGPLDLPGYVVTITATIPNPNC